MSNELQMVFIVILIVVLLIQGTWVFYDARKRKIKYFWFWGMICLINIPSNIIIYLLVRRNVEKKREIKGY